jgi:3-oxoacyl-[acyl-carrier-protein] synthase II
VNKVVVTGLGVVSPIGCDIDSFWEACLNNESNVQPIPEHWNDYSGYRSGIWSPLPKLDFLSQGFSRIEVMQRDPVSLLALMASKQALQQAKIETLFTDDKKRQYLLKGINSERVGVFIGTGIGGAKTFLENNACHMLKRTTEALLEEGSNPDQVSKLLHPSKVNPFVVSMLMQNAVSASVGIKYSLHGPNKTISQACSSGTSAIGYAYEAIKAGQIDLAICGGSEHLYDDYGSLYMGFDVARTLAKPGAGMEKANRPFDKDRSGFLISQGGSGILILESEAHAKKREANILAEVSGFAETFDAHSMMSINSDGIQIKRMINEAVNNANLQLSDIDYINTHGTSTTINDEVESKVIDELFSNKPLINSSKALLGHSIGASGAFEAIISTLSLQHQTTHRCKNLENPIRDLNFVTTQKGHDICHVLSESFAFGGHNSALVLSAFDA